MAVADQNVRPTIVIHIEEAASPTQKLRVCPETGGEGRVFETGSSLVMIERRSISGEIRFHNIEIAVHVVVGRRYTHSRLRLAVRTERASRFDRNIFELAVLLVLVQGARGEIIGDVDIGPTVVIEVSRQNAKAICTVRAQNS